MEIFQPSYQHCYLGMCTTQIIEWLHMKGQLRTHTHTKSYLLKKSITFKGTHILEDYD